MVTTMKKLGLLEKLDKSKMPNTEFVMDKLKKNTFDPNGEYSVVYTWGMTGIIYNKKYVKTAPTSWQDLWNPVYKGRVILLNDSREVIGMALKKHGFSNNATDPARLTSRSRTSRPWRRTSLLTIRIPSSRNSLLKKRGSE